MKVFLLIILLTIGVYSQQSVKDDCYHPGVIDRFRTLAVTAPAKISRMDGITLEYIVNDKLESETKELRILPTTDLPPDFAKNYKHGEWFILYCLTHHTIYQIQPVKPAK